MLSEYAKNNGWLDMNSYKHQLYDEFGNRLSIPTIEFYEKNSDGNWILGRTETSSNYVVINEQVYIYYASDESLMPLNMDFNSPNCHACCKVVKENTDFKRITGNAIIYCSPELRKRLCRQDYSDGTCFYTLQDDWRRMNDAYSWNVDEGSDSVAELIQYLERINEIDRQYIDEIPSASVNIEARKKLIDFMKSLEHPTTA